MELQVCPCASACVDQATVWYQLATVRKWLSYTVACTKCHPVSVDLHALVTKSPGLCSQACSCAFGRCTLVYRSSQVHQCSAAVLVHDAAPGAAAHQPSVKDWPHRTVWEATLQPGLLHRGGNRCSNKCTAVGAMLHTADQCKLCMWSAGPGLVILGEVNGWWCLLQTLPEAQPRPLRGMSVICQTLHMVTRSYVTCQHYDYNTHEDSCKTFIHCSRCALPALAKLNSATPWALWAS